MIILGLTGSTHDSSAAILVDGRVVAACEEERYCREKHAPNKLPIDAAKAVMKFANISPREIDYISYYFNPALYDSQIYSFLSASVKDILSKPEELKRVLNRGKKHVDKSEKIAELLGIKAPIKYINHHLAHASSAFYLSGLEESMILTLDNIGEINSTMAAIGKGTSLDILKEQQIPHSLGMLYATFTDYLGFRPFCDEGKVMALASYGKPSIALEEIIELENGEFRIKEPFTNLNVDKTRQFSQNLINKYGPSRAPNEPLTQRHKNIAASVQYAIEQTAVHIVTWMHNKTKLKNLCLGGGVALNCSMNGKLHDLPFIENMYIFPAAGDSGTSLGAAVYTHVRETSQRPAQIRYAGLGESWKNEEIIKALRDSNLFFRESSDPALEASKILMEDKVICWFSGRAELGPRALGHRSILALPEVETRDFINREVKHREMWRPLCPSILGKSVEKYAPNSSDGRFMIVTYNANDYAKARIPGVVHIDGTMRTQAVYNEENPHYESLLRYMGNLTGNPVLLNTSFNLKTEPIVNSPEDAIKSFLKMPVKKLILENFIAGKSPKSL
jgi:carbamoyltransferase